MQRAVCRRCGSPSHSRASHRNCPFNRDNVQSEHGPHYKKACTSSFVPEDVFGPNIYFIPGPSYHRHVLPRMESVCPFCGAYMWIEERLSNSSRSNPRYGLCCKQGKISLPLPQAPPEPLLSLLTDHRPSNPVAADFHTNIGAYNSLFAFASIRANFDEDLASGRDGVSTFGINGTMYRCIGSLRATEPQQAKFAQIYFCDAQEQLARRTSLFSGLNAETVNMIRSVMLQHNPFAREHFSAFEMYGNQPIGSLQVVVRAARVMGRRYNVQS